MQDKATKWRKVMRIGTIDTGRGRWSSVHIKAEISVKVETKEGGELSISGVIGALPSGNCVGACGQIDMEFQHRNHAQDDRRYENLIKPGDINFAPGWNKELWLDLLDIWKKWHLNGMNAGCEHMTGPEWNPSKKITLYYYRTKKHVRDTLAAFKERAARTLETGDSITPTAEEQRLACLPHKFTQASAELCPELAQDYEPNGAQYQGDHWNKASEEKTAGWVYPAEHPEGLLTKACPVCGYKYGSAWRKRELPQYVWDFLALLPDADKAPAWI